MEVPSLYVRVYRNPVPPAAKMRRSLIICEGISPANRQGRGHYTFPHYM